MASGDTLCVFFPAMSEPPSSNYATFDTRNGTLVLDYDSSTAESVQFPGFLPRHYDSGGITATIGWAATTATSGNVVWSLAVASVGDDTDDLDDSLFATAQTATVACASASGELSYDTIAFTDGAQMDSAAKGEYFRLKLERSAADSADTMAGDAELVFVEIKET